MDYIIKNKIISVGASSTVKDNNGNDVYKIRGKVFTFTKKKLIRDMDNNTLFIVRNKFFHILLPKVYITDPEGNILITIKKRYYFSLRKDFDLLGSDVSIDGDFIGRNYDIIQRGNIIGYLRRNYNLIKDSFLLETVDDSQAALMIALVIGLDNFFDKVLNSHR